MKKEKKSDARFPEEIAGKEPSAFWIAVATIGLLLVVAGTLLPIFNVYTGAGVAFTWFRYVYTAGAAIFLVAKLMTPYTGNHPRLKRLYRIESWSGVFFCVAAFFLYYEGGEARDWLAFTLAGGALLIFTSIAIPLTLRKANKR